MRSFVTKLLAGASVAALMALAPQAASADNHGGLKVSVLGSYQTNVFDEGAAEIVAHDPKTQRLFIANGNDKTIDIVDFSNPANMKLIKQVALAEFGKAANSVAVSGDMIIAAVEKDDKQANGVLVMMDADGNAKGTVEVGALPDMVAVSPDGKYAVVANEGEPNDDYTNDPEGTVSIVTLADKSVRTVRFTGLDADAFGPSAHFPSPEGTTVAQDLEPEYVAISGDSTTAFVSMQENNAMAVIDLASGEIKATFGLGLKDWTNLQFDVTDKDKASNLGPWPVKSMYQPDAIAAFEHDGETYIVTANEGDAREYEGEPGYVEETRVGKLKLDADKFPNAADLQNDLQLGRLKTTLAKGDTDGDGDHDEIYAFGGRSFSIYAADGTQVFDSGDAFTRILSKAHPTWFNSEGQESNFDVRSDDKGVEPEGVALGTIADKRYAFIGLERMGGIMVYDITDPKAPTYVTYILNADPKGDAEKNTAGDVAPEGLTFVAAENSPTGNALLVVANEVSGSTTAFELK